MLKNSMFLLVILIFAIACNDTSEIKSKFIGQWQVEYDSIRIDFSRQITSPLDIHGGQNFVDADEVQIIEFFEDGTYHVVENGEIRWEKGTYEITNENHFEFTNTIKPNEPLYCKGEFVLQGDELKMVCIGTQDGVPAYRKRDMVRVATE